MLENADRLFAEERQTRILALLDGQGKIMVSELCDRFSVSPATIRNDLSDLERQGRLKRTHGGAIALSKTGAELNFQQKQIKNSDLKFMLAEYAAGLVDDGDTLVLDTGTTMLALAEKLLKKKKLTVITPDIKIAALLDDQSEHTVILTGGILRKGFYCTTGSLVRDNLKCFRVDTCFLATNGLSLRAGLTTPNSAHAEIKRAMAEISSQVIVLCDSSKIGVDYLSVVMPLRQVDMIITDNNIDSEDQMALLEAKVPLTVVNSKDK